MENETVQAFRAIFAKNTFPQFLRGMVCLMIQGLLGHDDLKTTLKHIRVSTVAIGKTKSPFDGLSLDFK